MSSIEATSPPRRQRLPVNGRWHRQPEQPSDDRSCPPSTNGLALRRTFDSDPSRTAGIFDTEQGARRNRREPRRLRQDQSTQPSRRSMREKATNDGNRLTLWFPKLTRRAIFLGTKSVPRMKPVLAKRERRRDHQEPVHGIPPQPQHRLGPRPTSDQHHSENLPNKCPTQPADADDSPRPKTERATPAARATALGARSTTAPP